MKVKALKHLADLTPDGRKLIVRPPALEAEPLHRRLARLNRELTKATEELQSFNREWAKKNIEAQTCRLPISTPELTHAANKRRELALEIQQLQTELGAANKERRQLNAKASRQASPADQTTPLAIPPKRITNSKRCPLKEWTVYFELAARDELTPELYTQVERSAKSLLQHAIETGIEEP
jgi:hypothetical protein